jgi:hypothetical protein
MAVASQCGAQLHYPRPIMTYHWQTVLSTTSHLLRNHVITANKNPWIVPPAVTTEEPEELDQEALVRLLRDIQRRQVEPISNPAVRLSRLNREAEASSWREYDVRSAEGGALDQPIAQKAVQRM